MIAVANHLAELEEDKLNTKKKKEADDRPRCLAVPSVFFVHIHLCNAYHKECVDEKYGTKKEDTRNEVPDDVANDTDNDESPKGPTTITI
jgi:hypothetical protein